MSLAFAVYHVPATSYSFFTSYSTRMLGVARARVLFVRMWNDIHSAPRAQPTKQRLLTCDLVDRVPSKEGLWRANRSRHLPELLARLELPEGCVRQRGKRCEIDRLGRRCDWRGEEAGKRCDRRAAVLAEVVDLPEA